MLIFALFYWLCFGYKSQVDYENIRDLDISALHVHTPTHASRESSQLSQLSREQDPVTRPIIRPLSGLGSSDDFSRSQGGSQGVSLSRDLPGEGFKRKDISTIPREQNISYVSYHDEQSREQYEHENTADHASGFSNGGHIYS